MKGKSNKRPNLCYNTLPLQIYDAFYYVNCIDKKNHFNVAFILIPLVIDTSGSKGNEVICVLYFDGVLLPYVSCYRFVNYGHYISIEHHKL